MKAIKKEFCVQVVKTYNRFLSILLIVALGSAFYAGICSTKPDMQQSADKFYDETNLMDLCVVSTMGLMDDDVEAIGDIDSVEQAVGSYSEDVIAAKDDNEYVVTVMAYTDSINTVKLEDGRLPDNENECVVDAQFIDEGFEIGDTINMDSDNFSQDEFTIVGTFISSSYLALDKGTATIGNGDVAGVVVVNPEVFTMDYYTEIYVQAKGAKELTGYTDEYDDLVDAVSDDIEDIKDECEQRRYDELLDEVEDEVTAQFEEAQFDIDVTTEQARAGTYVTAEQAEALQEQLQEQLEEQLNEQIEEAKEQVEEPTWYIQDRSATQTYVEFGENANRIGNIGKVFPVVFFLVAAMVSLNTMTRMVEEERTKIGTLKAVGYSRVTIAMKYILYGFLATIIGSVLGGIAGSKLLPYIIINSYKIMYVNLPYVLLPINVGYFTIAVVASVVSVLAATLIACISTLKSTPAELMRPASPKQGKRVMLERMPFIWNRLSFQHKSTVRNLFRYKKRLIMTLFGIGGCMALLLVGFGLKDSINSIVELQYDNIETYEAMVTYSGSLSKKDKKTLYNLFDDTEQVKKYTQVYMNSIDIKDGNDVLSVYLCVPENTDDFGSYVSLHDCDTGEKFDLDNDGVVISQKMAELLDVDAGDSIYIEEDGEEKYELKIQGVCEYYVYHYVYMSPELYEDIYGEAPEYNTALLKADEDTASYSDEMTEEYLEYEQISNVTFTDDTRNTFDEMLGMLDIVALVLVISAGALAFVVLYNLNNINIAERIRELATLKVLGFYDREVSMYVFRENIVITVMGIIIGIGAGILLHRYVILTAELDNIMFGRSIKPASYIYSILLTLLFSLIINWSMHFKLKKVDMATSLKSVE